MAVSYSFCVATSTNAAQIFVRYILSGQCLLGTFPDFLLLLSPFLSFRVHVLVFVTPLNRLSLYYYWGKFIYS